MSVKTDQAHCHTPAAIAFNASVVAATAGYFTVSVFEVNPFLILIPTCLAATLPFGNR